MALINCPECSKEISDKAGACPNCGHPIENATPVTAYQHDPNIKLCPSCKDGNTQTIKMMCMSGTTTGKSTAIGVTTSLDVGVATINSHSQTNLAAQFIPGLKPSGGSGCAIFFIIIGVISVLAGLLNLSTGCPEAFMIGLVFGVPCLLLGYYVYGNKAKQQLVQIDGWEKKNKLYETGWICLKCGHTWLP